MEAVQNRPESQKARQEKLFQNIYNAASQAAGDDATDQLMKYSCDWLDEEFHIKFINRHIELHVDRLAGLFGFNLDKWIAKHWAGNLQFYTDGLFLSKGEVYSSIYGDICKAQSEALNCQS